MPVITDGKPVRCSCHWRRGGGRLAGVVYAVVVFVEVDGLSAMPESVPSKIPSALLSWKICLRRWQGRAKVKRSAEDSPRRHNQKRDR